MSTKSYQVLRRVELARRSLTVGLGALLIAPAVLSQDSNNAAEPAESGKLKDVTIRTGSNIPTAAEETVSPVAVYTSEKIAKLGVTDVNGFMQRLPIANQGALNGNNGGTGFAQGATGVSLRGLGLNATLVLLNGRRVAPFGRGDGGTITFVDLNSLPLAAIDRIEILREGASAIYGGDAIAGVVNFVTKKDFDGLLVTARYGNTFTSDTGEQTYSVTYGTHSKDGKTSVLLVADYLKKNAFFNRDREFSSNTDETTRQVYNEVAGPSGDNPVGFQSGYNLGSSFGFPGRFVVPRTAPGLVGTPFAGASGTRRLVAPHDTDGTAPASAYHIGDFSPVTPTAGSDLYNFLQKSQATPDSERYGIYGTVDHSIFDEKMVAFATFGMRRGQEHIELAPSPVDFAGSGSGIGIPLGEIRFKNGFKITGNQLTIPAANPWNPFGANLTAGRYRVVEAGNRQYDDINNTYQFTAGLRGDIIPEGRLSYETAVSYSRSENNTRAVQIGSQQLQNALNDVNPATSFNVFGGPNFHNNPATIESLKVRTVQETATQITSWDGRIFGALSTPILKAGDFGYALGTEYREERFFDEPDELAKAGAIVGSSPSRASAGHRSLNAAFIEGGIPITSKKWNVPGLYQIDIKAAGRLDSYSDFGESVVPLVGIAWRPFNDEWLLRASYGQSFRPPSLRQLFNAPQDALTGSAVRDPLRPGELLPQVPIVTSGNPNLKPENSDNWTAGTVYTPRWAPGLRLDAHWTQIKRRNEINQASTSLGGVSALAGTAGSYTRGPYDGSPNALIDPVTGQLAGPLLSLQDSYVNVGSTITDNVDFGITYELKTELAGTWTFTADITRQLSFRQEGAAGSGYFEYSGSVTSFDGFQRTRAVGSITWDYRKLTLTAVANYRSGMNYVDPLTGEGSLRLNSYATYDLQASYRLPWQTKVTVGIQNLLDKDPPTYIGEQGQAYLSIIDNPYGRTYYVELSKKF